MNNAGNALNPPNPILLNQSVQPYMVEDYGLYDPENNVFTPYTRSQYDNSLVPVTYGRCQRFELDATAGVYKDNAYRGRPAVMDILNRQQAINRFLAETGQAVNPNRLYLHNHAASLWVSALGGGEHTLAQSNWEWLYVLWGTQTSATDLHFMRETYRLWRKARCVIGAQALVDRLLQKYGGTLSSHGLDQY